MNKFGQGRRLGGATALSSVLLELSFWPHSFCSFSFRRFILCLCMRWRSRGQGGTWVKNVSDFIKSKEIYGHGLCLALVCHPRHFEHLSVPMVERRENQAFEVRLLNFYRPGLMPTLSSALYSHQAFLCARSTPNQLFTKLFHPLKCEFFGHGVLP